MPKFDFRNGMMMPMPERPISPLVNWIVLKTGADRTKIDNIIRANRHNRLVMMALSGDYLSRCMLLKQIGTQYELPGGFSKANTPGEIEEAAKQCKEAHECIAKCARPLIKPEPADDKNLTEALYPHARYKDTVPRGINKKPVDFHRRRKDRVPPANIEKHSNNLIETLCDYGGFTAEQLEPYFSVISGKVYASDELCRKLDELYGKRSHDIFDSANEKRDYFSINYLVKTIGTLLGIPAFAELDPCDYKGIIQASQVNRTRPVDEAMDAAFGNPLVEVVQYRKGHKNSNGEDAPWIIVSCKTKEILSSHKSKKQADEHLQQMEYYKHAKTESLKEALREGYLALLGY